MGDFIRLGPAPPVELIFSPNTLENKSDRPQTGSFIEKTKPARRSMKEMLMSNAQGSAALPYWQVKTLEEMNKREWEALCDGCARCCLNKLEDWDTGEIAWTSVACELLDGDTCRCRDYTNRAATIPDCVQLTPKAAHELSWLPSTCAYRLLAEGRDLYWWHPLVSGSDETVHAAGISVRGRTVSEEGMDVEDYEKYVVSWPNEVVEE